MRTPLLTLFSRLIANRFLLLAWNLAYIATLQAQSGSRSSFPSFETNPVLTTLLDVKNAAPDVARAGIPVRLRAVILARDAERGTVTFGDQTARIRVRFDPRGLVENQTVLVEGTACSAYPYPDRPQEQNILNVFEDNAEYYLPFLSRIRGFIHPPVTGDYTFWVASDDDTELYVAADDSPATARKIASVSGWTSPRVWTAQSSQKSVPIRLEAKRRYYVELLHVNWSGENHASVAWSGPGISREIIGERFLTPWRGEIPKAGESMPPPRKIQGLLREWWRDLPIKTLRDLSKNPASRGATELRDIRLTVMSGLSAPAFSKSGGIATPGATGESSWVEEEGTVVQASRSGTTSVLHLSREGRITYVHVWNPEGRNLYGLLGTSISARGLPEFAVDEQGARRVASLRVAGLGEIRLRAPLEPGWLLKPTMDVGELHRLPPASVDQQPMRIYGRVGEIRTNGFVRLEHFESRIQAFYSLDGATWRSVGEATFSLGADLLWGMAVCSKHEQRICSARFSELNGLAPSPISTDLGQPGREGTVEQFEGKYLVRGAGRDIWSATQEGQFAHSAEHGDHTLIARLDWMDKTEPWAKAGLMLRDYLNAPSKYAYLGMAPDHGVFFQFRPQTGGSCESINITGLQPPCWLKLSRELMPVHVDVELAAIPNSLQPGEVIEVCGIGEWNGENPRIKEAFCRVTEIEAGVQSAGSRSLEREKSDRLLSRIAQVRDLSPDELRANFPVKVRAVITSNRRDFLVAQDSTGGIFVKAGEHSLHVGDMVEIEGQTDPGGFSPVLVAERFKVLGTGRLPVPRQYTWSHLMTGREDCQWIEEKGVVRSVQGDTLDLVIQGGRISAKIHDGIPPDMAARLIGSRVKVVGVCRVTFNTNRKATGISFLVPSLEFVGIEKSSRDDPFETPLEKISEVTARGGAQDPMPGFVRVRGAVTFAVRERLFIQDGAGAIQVESREPVPFHPGQTVDVIGFPQSVGAASPRIVEARLRETASGGMVFPIDLDADEIIRLNSHGKLVRVEGTLLEQKNDAPGQVLQLQSGQRTFRAVLEKGLAPEQILPPIRPGSLVSLVGVCDRESAAAAARLGVMERGASAASFQMLLRSPGDLLVLARPPWWTVKRMLGIVGTLICVLLIAFAWIQALRFRVEQRTAELQSAMSRLRKETQLSATLTERNRIAGEIHDSLEQGFSGLVLQLDAMAKLAERPDAVRAYLSVARSMVCFSRAEVKHALWDLQSPILENSDLPGALTQIARHVSPENLPRVEVETIGEPRPLSSSVEHHLLRIGQEAITNAVKHSGGRNIHVTLRWTGEFVRVSIVDDGRGFVASNVLAAEGHFGLRGLRSRARKVGGELMVSSEPGKGTRIEITVPLGAKNGSIPELSKSNGVNHEQEPG